MTNINLTLEESKSLAVDREFRQDINLLRGVAILSVVLYHFAPTLLPGGFVGVDIFFVISGFLMTKIISTGLKKRSFKLLEFYAARSKRIIPALLTLCIIMALATLFWLPTNEYRKLGNYIGYIVLFISNIKLKKESGNYFATDSHENWFLHTWSLSVEWQFYLILPFIIIGLYPLRKWVNTGLCLLVLTLGAFWFSMSATENDASRFYLMPYRAWEMLCGGLVWYGANRLILTRAFCTLITLLGYTLITASVFFINDESAWPGGLTLLPIIGTMLVIYGNDNSLISLADRNLRWVGLSSYSVYLWHWPVAVYLIYAGHQHNGLWVLSAIVLSFLIGWVSWVLIEQPAKNFLNQRSVAAFWIILFSCIGTAWGYSYLVKNDIIVSRPNAQVDRIAAEANNKNYAADPKTHMSFYGTGTPAAIIIGDSHAEAAATALAAAAADRGSVVGITYSGCPTLADATLLESKRCGKFNRSLSEKLKAYPSNVPVVIVNRLTHYAEKRQVRFNAGPLDEKDYLQQYAASIVKMACTLNHEHPVVLVNPVPEMGVNVPRTLSHRLMTSKKAQDISIPLAEYQNRNSAILQAQSQAAETCGVKVLDPTPYLCSAGRCMGSKNLEPHYFDDNHLSETGNKALVPMFRQIFTQRAH